MSRPTDATPNDSLAALRQQLDELDERLLETAAQRLAIVERVFRVKARDDRSLFDRERERVVIEKAQQTAQLVGLEPQAAHELIRAMVEASHRLQERGFHRDEAASDQSRRFLIVGGGGQMGQLFKHTLEDRGHR